LIAGQSPVEWTEELTEEQKKLEKWMLALRLDEGFPSQWIQTPLQKARLDQMMSQGLVQVHPASTEKLRLTARGFALSDQIIQALT
jgi:coproporphyrinogen III oxidase-like Fe-S oxidoreductase